MSSHETTSSSGKADQPELSLIIPTYNEAENLPRLVERVHSTLEGHAFELIVVDDDSPDGTAGVASDLSRDFPLKLVVRTGQRGLATAAIAGFGHASGQVLGVMDADLQHPPEYLPQILAAIDQGFDLVIASRYSQGGADQGSIVRRCMSKSAALLTRTVVSPARKTPDPLSGFFLLRREVVEGVELEPVGYKLLLEVLVRGKARRVTSLPYAFERRLAGDSKFNLSEQVTSLRHIMRLAFADIRRAGPFSRVARRGNS